MVPFCGQQASKNTTYVIEWRIDILGVNKMLNCIKTEDPFWIKGIQVSEHDTFIFQIATATFFYFCCSLELLGELSKKLNAQASPWFN